MSAFGGPAGVALEPEVARQQMQKVGGHLLSKEKVWAVVASASTTTGLPQLEEEVHLLRTLAADARRAQRSLGEAQRRIQALAESEPSTRALQAVVGKTTAGVLVATAGDPRNYDSPSAYAKGLGLNLRERSSGRKQGQLHITKRGSGTARRWLYLATLRLLMADPVVRAWYASKVSRDGGRSKVRAVVAVMRKLALSLWYVARGDTFDATKLFDVRRLTVAS
jgi:transposase